MFIQTSKTARAGGRLLFRQQARSNLFGVFHQTSGQATLAVPTAAAPSVPPFGTWSSHSPTARIPQEAVFDTGFACFGQIKPQGEQPTGDKPAENPRNDVPPVSSEEREKNPDIPPSPDNTSGEANSADYTSPGTHPSNDEGFEPDLDNASEAVKRNASGSREALMGASQSENEPTGGDGTVPQTTGAWRNIKLNAAQAESEQEGPASHDDDPPGVDKDPNVVPPTDDGNNSSKDK